jgi:hypothetical protein
VLKVGRRSGGRFRGQLVTSVDDLRGYHRKVPSGQTRDALTPAAETRLLAPKNKAAVGQGSDYGGKFPNSTLYGLLAIGYWLLFNVAALLHGALDLVLARLERLLDGHFAS